MRADRLTGLFFLLIVFAGTAQAAAERFYTRPYGEAGCGWGSVVMGYENQVLAATTNGISFNQTFGISSGTSQCTDFIRYGRTVETFIEVNHASLQRDIAAGNGAFLATLEELMACPAGAVGEFVRHREGWERWSASDLGRSLLHNVYKSPTLRSCQAPLPG